MPRISLCLIARNEEEMLPGCLQSVEGIVDEVVLVDTGSEDRTKELAAAAGARVFDLPWNDDFSAPRNEAVRQARGDWLLQLDADERLAPGAGKKLLRAIRRGGFDVGQLPLHNASRLDAAPEDVLAGRARIAHPIYMSRLLRNAGDPRYTGTVHESVEEWFYSGRRKTQLVEAPIIHLGYVASLVASLGKHERNLALLRRRCEEVPDDLFALGYLASELHARGDLEEAWAVVERGWAVIARRPSFRFVHRLAVVRASLAVERGRPETAIETLKLAVEQRGEQFDFACWAGRAWDAISHRETDPAHRQHAGSAAAACYERALDLLPLPATEKHTDAGPATLQIARGHALLVADRLDDARVAFDAALQADPGSAASRLGLAEISLRVGQVVEALKMIEAFLVDGRPVPDAWLLAAEAARALGSEATAEKFEARARACGAASFLAAHRGALLNRATGDRAAAGFVAAHGERSLGAPPAFPGARR